MRILFVVVAAVMASGCGLLGSLTHVGGPPQAQNLLDGYSKVNDVHRITFHEKASLLAADRWESEIERRLALSENTDKYADVSFEREPQLLRISIRDRGPGFDWRSYLTLNESRALYPNGRGIAVARHVAFRSLEFVEPGNQVIATATTPQ